MTTTASERTLSRRLLEQGTTYHSVLDRVRRDLADELLSDADHKLSDEVPGTPVAEGPGGGSGLQDAKIFGRRAFADIADGDVIGARAGEGEGLAIDAVNVKAKTGEGVGAIGRAEAIGCTVAALIERA